jgi:hypothetical protein
MRSQYRTFVATMIIVNLICWYYVTVFCGVYITSAKGWIYGSITSIILDWFGISILIPVIRTGIRLIVRKYQKMRFLVTVEYLFFIKNLFG